MSRPIAETIALAAIWSFFQGPVGTLASNTGDELELVTARAVSGGWSDGSGFSLLAEVSSPEGLGPTRSPDETFEVWGGTVPTAGPSWSLLFADGFETGDLLRWSEAVPMLEPLEDAP